MVGATERASTPMANIKAASLQAVDGGYFQRLGAAQRGQ